MEWRVRTQTKALSTVFIRINGFSRLGLIPSFCLRSERRVPYVGFSSSRIPVLISMQRLRKLRIF